MSKPRTEDRADFLASIAVTAAEGGIGYWSVIEGPYRWAFVGDDPATTPAPEGWDGTRADVAYTIVECGDEAVTDESPRFEVTLDTIAKGLRMIREAKATGEESWGTEWTTVKYLSVGARSMIMRAERERDAGEIDSSLADVIVQVATLGEVRYG